MSAMTDLKLRKEVAYLEQHLREAKDIYHDDWVRWERNSETTAADIYFAQLCSSEQQVSILEKKLTWIKWISLFGREKYEDMTDLIEQVRNTRLLIKIENDENFSGRSGSDMKMLLAKLDDLERQLGAKFCDMMEEMG